MRSARSSRSLRPERTPCAHCGRDTQTSSDGACVECWHLKGRRLGIFPMYRPHRESSFFWSSVDDLFTRWGLFIAWLAVLLLLAVLAAWKG
jgi:hypothetical protein